MKLVTKEQWSRMSPKTQGYALYMQAKLPGSELVDVKNPYYKWTRAYGEFVKGEQEAILEVMESES